MNQFKKQEISMFISICIGMLAVGILSGDLRGFLALLITFIGVTGGFYSIYRLVLFILNKIYPESSTITKGAISTIIKDIKLQ
jgi:hypothetical protein